MVVKCHRFIFLVTSACEAWWTILSLAVASVNRQLTVSAFIRAKLGRERI